ncbi:hypothetical protein GN958_ATG14600 [Phytophthora infestans]|uniref:Uncharacterized protein n=1 Tax=Phytophthora infestans TaxID=4787 RepID=A0A8S9U591_PHYIN|nr:hypothetical protein GN958_ATG14600 [Phytophthora infestans]
MAASGNLKAVNYLYKNGHDDEEAVGKAFTEAAGSRNQPDVCTVSNAAAMILMCDNEEISDRSLIRAFKIPTNRNGEGDLEVLVQGKMCFLETHQPGIRGCCDESTDGTHLHDTRVTDRALSEAFEVAATRDDAALLGLLYDPQRVSNGVLLKAFNEVRTL